MNTELLEALNILEQEKDISKETLLDAIENSLLNACKNHFGKADNVKVIMDRTTCDYKLFAEKTVVEDPTVSKIVKSLEGQIEYKAYTITSEMTADGKFVSITHYGIGYIKANINGSINAKGELEFNAKYTDFQY